MKLQSTHPCRRSSNVFHGGRARGGGLFVRVATALVIALVLAGCGASETATESGAGLPAPSDGNAPGVIDGADPAVTDADPAAEGAGRAPDDRFPESLAPTVSTDGDVPPAEFPTGIEPVHIKIPAIDVDAPVIDLDLRGDEPEVPENFADTGWYQQTRLPGEIGPSVIAGHIDSVDGPAVFARLSLLEPGDHITVIAANGEQRSFTVVSSGQYPKTALPDEVFGFGQPVPELRLITCGGTFDRTVRHYVDNFVVYAVSSNQSPSAL